jgi:DNA (cytosine-5)-methyltransferase 1
LPLDATRAQAVAFQQSQSGFRQHETHATLDSNNGSRRRNGVVQALCEGGHGVTEMDTATAVQSGGGKAGQGYQAVREGASSVRRLTPRECERLQGFPDGWTDVVYRGKAASDGARYKCLGNAFAVPVVTWIARRMVREDALALAPAEVAA